MTIKTITIDDLASMDEPQNGWYHIEAAGEHPAERDGTTYIQVLDDAAMRAIAAAGCPEEGILLDTEHRSVPGCAGELNTEAAGWVRELATFDDGQGHLHLAGRIEWSDTGLAAVQGRRYKHFSTVYQLGNDAATGQPDPALCEHLGGERWRPLALLGLALTNNPNNYGQRPIVNARGMQPTSPLPAPAPEDHNHTEQNTTMNELEEIKKALGLAPDASLEDTLCAIGTLKAGAAEAAEAEAETLLNAEGLSDLPEEEKKQLKEGLQTNRGLALMTIRAMKERNAASATPRYARGNAPLRPLQNGNTAATIVNHAHAIQKREREAGRDCSFWRAKTMAKQELAARDNAN